MSATESGIDRARRAVSRVRTDARLLVFPVVAAVGCTVALAAVFFGVRPAIETLVGRYGLTDVSRFGIVAVLLVVGYTLCALVITFSNAGLVWASAKAVRGESVRLRGAIAAVWQHRRQLLMFGLVTGLVGSLLGIAERRIEFVSKVTVAILGAGYTVFSFFVVPAVVLDDVSTSEMFTRSLELVRANTTEVVVLSLGVVAACGFVGGLPLFLLVVVVIASELLALGVAPIIESNILFFGSVGIVLLAGGLLLGSSLAAVSKAELYVELTGEGESSMDLMALVSQRESATETTTTDESASSDESFFDRAIEQAEERDVRGEGRECYVDDCTRPGAKLHNTGLGYEPFCQRHSRRRSAKAIGLVVLLSLTLLAIVIGAVLYLL